jgi:hypothetical protein
MMRILLSHDRAGEPDPIAAPADDGEPAPMSLDRDASDRTFDRQLAYLGLLDDAAPLFREGSSIPAVGILLALPCLVESGLLRISRKLYGEIGPAFYGLRTTLLTLLFMALLRIAAPSPIVPISPSSNANMAPPPRPIANSAARPSAASRSPMGTARDRVAKMSAVAKRSGSGILHRAISGISA